MEASRQADITIIMLTESDALIDPIPIQIRITELSLGVEKSKGPVAREPVPCANTRFEHSCGVSKLATFPAGCPH